MGSRLNDLPFRLGTSSYILPDDILPNARYLAGKVQDIELVLFEVDEGPSNLPPPQVVAELRSLALHHDLTYTVHLPLDLRLGADGDEQHVSLVKARRVIDTVHSLAPWAYVLHLDGKEFQTSPPGDALRPAKDLLNWQNQAVRALELVAQWAGGPGILAVENLEGYPLDFWDLVLERTGVSRCVDVGHLWRDGRDPLPFLERTFLHTRVIHWHGIGSRDHQSLANMTADQVDRVLAWMLSKPYSGVVTLEIFNQEDFASSLQAISESLDRLARS